MEQRFNDPDSPEAFGVRLEAVIVGILKIKKAELARRIDASPTSVSQWTTRTVPKIPEHKTLLKICALSGVTYGWLRRGEGFHRLPTDLQEKILAATPPEKRGALLAA